VALPAPPPPQHPRLPSRPALTYVNYRDVCIRRLTVTTRVRREPYRQAAPAPEVVKDDKLKEDADKQFFQATFHWHHGELEEAHKLCSKAIGMFPKHKRAFLLRCEVALKLKRFDQATEDASTAIAMGHKEGHRTRGAVHLERGRFRDAVADLNVAVRIEPSDRRAWSLRARAHQGLGNAARAKEDAAEAGAYTRPLAKPQPSCFISCCH
jgi:predicted Zn-dependent protease